ncbi:MAG TPA: hypothetical protein VKE42_00555, partial [Candidatus Cybelea sp.]|nr:hypothetical protein [Candidatus Cybelea sp.]
ATLEWYHQDVRWMVVLLAFTACGDDSAARTPDAPADAAIDACTNSPPAEDVQRCGLPPCSCRFYVIYACDPRRRSDLLRVFWLLRMCQRLLARAQRLLAGSAA